MSEQQLLECITLNPKVMVGKPVIRGTRLTVEYILNLLAHGATIPEILEEYKGLTQLSAKVGLCMMKHAAWTTTMSLPKRLPKIGF